MLTLNNEEARQICRLTKGRLRSPRQKNAPFEADAEIVDCNDRARQLLCVTTDSIVEEIQSGLYDDPFFMGWMLAMVNFSDLAAVGAEPLGLLTSLVIPAGWCEDFMTKLGEGIEAACRQLDSHVLGGDLNRGISPVLTGTALGTVPERDLLTRCGCRPGDRVYLSGRAGAGNVFAFLHMQGHKADFRFQPVARIAEGIALRGIANSCMDTSDGVLLTFSTLAALNDCRFVLTADLENIVHPAALTLCESLQVSPLAALAGIHGEFELVFTVPPEREDQLQAAARKINWHPLQIGIITDGEGVSLQRRNQTRAVDCEQLQELSSLAGANPQAYIAALLDFVRA